MDVEKTIEFLLENQARFDARMEANFAKAEERFAKAEKRMDRVERVVAQLSVVGLRFRNEIRQAQRETDRLIKALAERQAQTAERQAEAAERQAETDDKLNALIDIVDKMARRNNGRKN